MLTPEQEEFLRTHDFALNGGKPEKCINCVLNRVCERAFTIDNVSVPKAKYAEVECHYETKGKFREKIDLLNKWQSFVESDPKYFLERLMLSYSQLEKEAYKDFSYAKGLQMNFLLQSIFKLKFGEKKQVESNTNNTSTNITADIQQLLDLKRDKNAQNIPNSPQITSQTPQNTIDITPIEVTPKPQNHVQNTTIQPNSEPKQPRISEDRMKLWQDSLKRKEN